ncbi:Ig-like domain-containing protein [bacterium]|nr:Ig-like domain-containing protein [bacterium]
MKEIKQNKKLVLYLTALLGIVCAVFYITCSGPLEDTGDEPPIGSIKPAIDVLIEFHEINGDYSCDADGQSTLTFVATVTDQYGNPWKNVNVEFQTELGSVNPPNQSTDSNGQAHTTYTASCIPGSTSVQAYAIGRLVFKNVNLYGDYPWLDVEASVMNIGGAGYNTSATIIAQFWCSQNTSIQGADIGFWSEYGCFDFKECPDMRETGINGVASAVWFPPMYGSYEDNWSDFNAPLSSVVKATLYEGETEFPEYYDYDEIFIYPLHADLWIQGIDGEEVYDHETDTFLLCDGTEFIYWVYVFWYTNEGFYPQIGINVTFSTEGLTISSSSGTTDATGYAGGFITLDYEQGVSCNANTTFSYGSLSASINQSGTPNCCQNTTETKWTWSRKLRVGIPDEPDGNLP